MKILLESLTIPLTKDSEHNLMWSDQILFSEYQNSQMFVHYIFEKAVWSAATMS